MERNLQTAVRTTVDLVCKDYAQEADEKVVKQAAQDMAASLAGSLVQSYCRDNTL